MLSETRELLRTDTVVFAIASTTCVAQTVGFMSRTSGHTIQSVAGVIIMVLALPAAWVLWADRSAGIALWNHIGPALFVAFCAVSFYVDYVPGIEFRDPVNGAILVPYLLLFYGSILFMGLRLFPVSRPLWAVTAAAAVALLWATGWAQFKGVG